MRKTILVLGITLALAGLLAGAAYAENPVAEAPAWKVGDEWRFTGGGYIRVVAFEDGYWVTVSPSPQGCKGECRLYRDKHGEAVKMVDGNGEPFVSNDLRIGWRTLDFPLSVGKTWKVEFQSTTSEGGLSSFRNTYKVEKFEEVKVKAGIFKAFKISLQSENLRYRSGAFDFEYWYAPEVATVVKYVTYSSYGGRGIGRNWELESYTRSQAVAEKPSPPKVEAPKALEHAVVAEKPPQKPTEQPVVAEAPVPSKSAAPVVVEKAAARPLAEEAAARPKAGAAFNEGDVLRPKISNVKVLGKPSEAADTVSILAKGDEVIFLGKEQDDFVNVETAKGSGWVKRILVTR